MSWITQVNRIREMNRHFLLYLYLLSSFGDVVNQLLPTQYTRSIRQVLPNRVHACDKRKLFLPVAN